MDGRDVTHCAAPPHEGQHRNTWDPSIQRPLSPLPNVRLKSNVWIKVWSQRHFNTRIIFVLLLKSDAGEVSPHEAGSGTQCLAFGWNAEVGEAVWQRSAGALVSWKLLFKKLVSLTNLSTKSAKSCSRGTHWADLWRAVDYAANTGLVE